MSTDAQNTQQTAPGAQATYDLTLVVPCYNEADNIPLFYKTATECFENAGVKLEIVFVNDGSQDGSAQLLRRVVETARACTACSWKALTSIALPRAKFSARKASC